jgi:hypothetical protein
MHMYFSSLHMENKVKKDKIDTLLELCQNMFNPTRTTNLQMADC